MSERLQRWMQSDLVGVFATVAVLVAVALALFFFFVIGPIAGIIYGVALVGLTFYLITKTSRGGAADIADIAPPAAETAQQVLVVANQGLGNPALETELARRADLGPLEVRLIAPAPASSLARRVADDVDAEAAKARERLDAAMARISARGVTVSGHVDEQAEPMRSLLDGLREFPADDVLLVPGDELDWTEAESLAEQIRSETDVRVTEIGG